MLEGYVPRLRREIPCWFDTPTTSVAESAGVRRVLESGIGDAYRPAATSQKAEAVPEVIFVLPAHRPTLARLVALTGFMGAGKSTVGQALALLLGWKFLDLDDEIERRQKQSIRDVFRSFGEARFREIETIALGDALGTVSSPTVIALGGGTFIQTPNVTLLKGSAAIVVFLETPVEELFNRCRTTVSPEENIRPLAADPDAFTALYERRLPQYRRADLVITTAGKSGEDIAAEIVSALRLHGVGP
jgi:shikimate kinase